MFDLFVANSDLHKVPKCPRAKDSYHVIIPTSDSFSTHVNSNNSAVSNSFKQIAKNALTDHYRVATIDVEGDISVAQTSSRLGCARTALVRRFELMIGYICCGSQVVFRKLPVGQTLGVAFR